jgi:hypothetical protein
MFGRWLGALADAVGMAAAIMGLMTAVGVATERRDDRAVEIDDVDVAPTG